MLNSSYTLHSSLDWQIQKLNWPKVNNSLYFLLFSIHVSPFPSAAISLAQILTSNQNSTVTAVWWAKEVLILMNVFYIKVFQLPAVNLKFKSMPSFSCDNLWFHVMGQTQLFHLFIGIYWELWKSNILVNMNDLCILIWGSLFWKSCLRVEDPSPR